MASKAKSFKLNTKLVATNAYAHTDGELTRKVLADKTTKEILEIYNANAASIKEPERKSFKDHDTAVKTTWEFLQDLFGTVIEGRPEEASTAGAAAGGKDLGNILNNPESNMAKKDKAAAAAPAADGAAAATAAPKKEKKAKVAVPKTPRGTDKTYEVLSKDNPFKEGTARYDLWNIIKVKKSTAEARAADKRISTPFMDELVGREYIKYTGENTPPPAPAKPAAEAAAATA